MARLRGLTALPKSGEKRATRDKGALVIENPEEGAFEMEAESAESFIPLSITGRWKRTPLREAALMPTEIITLLSLRRCFESGRQEA